MAATKVTLKEVFESHNWIITKIYQGFGTHRIDAKTRNRIADSQNTFSKYGSNAYLEKLAHENYGKSLSDFTCYNY